MGSSPASVMMHIPVSRLEIVHAPGLQAWEALREKLRSAKKQAEDLHDVTSASFILRSAASPHTFRRTFVLHDWINIALSEVSFYVIVSDYEMAGHVMLKTGKGYFVTTGPGPRS